MTLKEFDLLNAGFLIVDDWAANVGVNGSQQKFQVNGEPMFNQSSRFIGYRGIGVELSARK